MFDSLAAANALLPLGSLAIANATDHKVDGRVAVTPGWPSVAGVRLAPLVVAE